MEFGTKAATLQKLEGEIRHARVFPQFCFTLSDWGNASSSLEKIGPLPDWLDFRTSLIVRSSGVGEDSHEQSLAGHFESVLNVTGRDELVEAIEQVCQSFKDLRGL